MAPHRLACIGGGPAGLYTAILARRVLPDCEVTVYERNPRDATFGFGVVFSDETLDNIADADPVSYERIEKEFRYWSDLEIRKGSEVTRSTGHGFAAFPRLRLLQILADRATELGAEVRFETPVDDPESIDADVVVCAEGVNSSMRKRWQSQLDISVRPGAARYAWFGTEHDFGVFTFIFEETPHGVVQAHCYPYIDDGSTFIVELADQTWHKLGLQPDQEFQPGKSDPGTIAFSEELFGRHLDGHGLIGNFSQWIQFPEVTGRNWWSDRYVFLGDAIHTAHFSIGSGTKLALEDAIALVDALGSHENLEESLQSYQESRIPQVESTQRAARTSQDWFENVDRYWSLPDPQFDFQLLTRSQRINLDNLQVRDPVLSEKIVDWWRGSRPLATPPDAPPMFAPFQLREVVLPNRVGVSPMAQYCAVDGVPNTWHLVHLGSRAVGGAGLVMVEMTCVTPEGRITPGCTGLWNDEQAEGFGPIVDFVHDHTDAVLGMQLGHSGRKGGMRVPWEVDGDDYHPLEGEWERLSASPVSFLPDGPVPTEMTQDDMEETTEAFVAATVRSRDLGFNLLELHFAHGYLLSSFISPLTNHRTDGYGGDLEGRLRYPCEVITAVRNVWPDDLPLSVRISATDWADGGTTGDDTVEMARRFAELGVDIIDVSTGQVVSHQQPRYGRLYQTPFADRIRLETGMPTMTVGSVSSVDDVNTVLVAGRSDICLMARPHLVDPYWTLNATMDQGYPGHPWPPQYLMGANTRRRLQDPDDRVREPEQRTL
ncbi:MAG: bifunctional salicylyl-CoA 5-hydroxylase/oxidoreductase [Acidimicrobiia bacterium]|nr:bifunctional salicylyl-CoA 5-hydroxylase/oxidoreductase [Acidimicrobiia bacterium]